MAGMLPGVETARRRRVHQSCSSSSSSSFGDFTHFSMRRSSIPMYSTYHEPLLLPSMQTNPRWYGDEKLDKAAREAKERLDKRLQTLRKSDTKREPNRPEPSINSGCTRPIIRGHEQTEIVRSKKSGSKRFGWAKLSWKSSEQDECAVCLEQFKTAEKLMHLACAHKFHARCLLPWLHTKSHCPCCRMLISME